MLLLLIVLVVVVAGLVVGWRVFAQETSTRAANALFLVLGVAILIYWLVSTASFSAGV